MLLLFIIYSSILKKHCKNHVVKREIAQRSAFIIRTMCFVFSPSAKAHKPSAIPTFPRP